MQENSDVSLYTATLHKLNSVTIDKATPLTLTLTLTLILILILILTLTLLE